MSKTIARELAEAELDAMSGGLTIQKQLDAASAQGG